MRIGLAMWSLLRSAVMLLAAGALLAGCFEPPADPHQPYGHWLSANESVERAELYPPFTVLHIFYSKGGSYFSSAQLRYDRILYQDQVLVRKADSVSAWEGPARPVLFAQYNEENLDLSQLHIVYEHGNRGVVERIDAGKASWAATYEFPVGFGAGRHLRYFPAQLGPGAGFLVSVFPARVWPLPKGDARINLYAATAPDGHAFAYVDDANPTAVMVVDADGAKRDPVAIPVARLSRTNDFGSLLYQPIYPWFAGSFDWIRNGAGKWEVAARGAVPPTQSDGAAVEALFLDAATGYRACFSTTNPACRPGWRRLAGAEIAEVASWLPHCCVSPYWYVPKLPTQAFGADIEGLGLPADGPDVTSYQLVLRTTPDQLAQRLMARLAERRIPTLRLDGCPAKDDPVGCEAFVAAELIRVFRLKVTPDFVFVELLTRALDGDTIIVTPTFAGWIGGKHGRAWIAPLQRYDGVPVRPRD